jgi:pyrroloquinoline quinone biosynthesis protein D
MDSPPIPVTACPRISARARLQTDKVTGKPMLLYPEGALVLNPTAHAIVLLCNGRDTLESIVSSLATRYQTSAEKIENEVSQLLNRLRAKNLLEPFDAGIK